MKQLPILIILSVMLISVLGCETTKGAGRDIENTGHNIERGVQDITP